MIKKFKEKIRQKLISDFASLFSKEKLDGKELERVVNQILEELISREHSVISTEERLRIVNEIIDECMGFGPIDSLLKDPSITEIMINGPKKIYIERSGKTELANVAFDDEHQLMALVHKILTPTRRRVDESYPFTDVSLKDGSRVNIIIAPLALDGPVMTIRKFLKEISKIEDLVQKATLDTRMADFLIACIKAKVNIIFSGATGSGKTTTLNVLSSYIANDERIVTIEDTAELRLNQEHVVRLESRVPNIEGKGEVSIRDLFRNSLRMRPDRIILGEIRGVEALDMLQAMCSGHQGSLAVLHADSPQDVIYRLETLIITSGLAISIEAIHRQIAASVDLVVQQEQLHDGSRKITRIAQIRGLHDKEVVVEDIFKYEIDATDDVTGVVSGRWFATGIVPECFHEFKKRGIILSEEIFRKDT